MKDGETFLTSYGTPAVKMEKNTYMTLSNMTIHNVCEDDIKLTSLRYLIDIHIETAFRIEMLN